MNSFGELFRLTSFGESHGEAIGGVIDGMPAGIEVDYELLRREMERRRPGQSRLTTQRNEADEVQLLSGIYDGTTTGTPIGFIVRNTSQRSQDYDALARLFRPSHADYTYLQKYGLRDPRGGGRSSARETLTRCVAGAFAKMALREKAIKVEAYTSAVGELCLQRDYRQLDLDLTETNPVRCPDEMMAERMAEIISEAKAAGDTVGGVVTCIVRGCPIGLGEPVFGRLQAQLAAAMMSINAVKGFEYGLGFDGSKGYGSEQNDVFEPDGEGGIRLRTNRSGGIQGGISNGEDIVMRVAFKPVATILQEQETVDTDGRQVRFKATGRHDPCVVPRAVPIVENMAAIVILDAYLQHRARRNF